MEEGRSWSGTRAMYYLFPCIGLRRESTMTEFATSSGIYCVREEHEARTTGIDRKSFDDVTRAVDMGDNARGECGRGKSKKLPRVWLRVRPNAKNGKSHIYFSISKCMDTKNMLIRISIPFRYVFVICCNRICVSCIQQERTPYIHGIHSLKRQKAI